MERFTYVLHKLKYSDLPEDAVRTLFLKGISEDYIETLNLMKYGDVSHKNFTKMFNMCRNYSRSRAKTKKNIHEPCIRNPKGNTRRIFMNPTSEIKKGTLLVGSQEWKMGIC